MCVCAAPDYFGLEQVGNVYRNQRRQLTELEESRIAQGDLAASLAASMEAQIQVSCCVLCGFGCCAAAHGQALIGVAEKLVLLHACTATLGGTCMLGTGVASIQGLIDALLIALFHWPPVSVS